ncbi:ABC transporter ATP-binding protein [Microlunatus sp. GCM10028923]|uniref:ABC transporter ATP-binding protein n=1 Tax=Microlunatus sp. GCM10028923 TaxID=3273400 RepID=UPI00361DCE1C
MPAEPAVRAVGLAARYPGGGRFGPVDLVVRPGEYVLVLGPSGSGKSTLLRLLHGAVPRAIDAEVTGELTVAGRRVADHEIAELANLIGVVAQDPESGVCLSAVTDEVAFPLENLAVDPAAIGPAVGTALDRADATRLADRDTAELSGGELQRVALAAAVATEPRLLLLDEPTSMLDAAGVDAVRNAIAAARRGTGAACVLVEHRLDELTDDALELPDRWVVIDSDGLIRHDGPPDDLGTEALRDLVGQGCWLPIELELRAAFGLAGGLDDPVALEALLTATRPEPVEGPNHVPSPLPFDQLRDRRAVLRARNLSVGRGGRAVLSEVDLEVRPGEVTALVGANGSGKSTLLRCLAGLERPLAGRVDGPRPGLVFQNPEHQFAAATVAEELAFGLPPESSSRVDELLRRFGLTDLADRNPYRLSGGQQRRVSLAAMLLHDRPHLLADEPGFGLDRPATITMLRTLAETAATGRGVLFSSHDLRAVAGYADRVLVLGQGGLLADTTPLGLLRDEALLTRAGLRAPRLLHRLAAEPLDEAALRSVLTGLDAAALQERVSP